jgi:hypothetical protein
MGTLDKYSTNKGGKLAELAGSSQTIRELFYSETIVIQINSIWALAGLV